MAAIEEKSKMGRVTTHATIENIRDLWEAESGRLQPDSVRRIAVSDALVDTGAFTLSLPMSMIRNLGLEQLSSRRVMTAAGPRMAGRYSAVRLTIQGRDMIVDVSDVPDGCPVLIGQIPLEYMDWVVDPVNQRLIGNPAHGGEWINDMF
jgi:predicted aspartyl protease